ncbi:polymorphic toxin-type HINT domain-containing protein [Tundrisphaera sp. TA3]|uniref:polymorphic toxin-type HINT domain-containing protein n=1 Tax=Tundrisphaera sp. TA3 TaxID=3435775 RepID=UPI003EB7612B
MLAPLVVGLSLLASGQAPDAAPAAPLAEYEAKRAEAARDPDAQVRLALWCEAHGLQAQRFRHLALAVLADPSHATARGLMGLVAYRGKWQSPEAVADKLKADADRARLLAEYDDRRSRAPYTGEGQWRMAQWCEENGLADQARAHLTAVTRLDPSRDAAWKRLGYARHDGRWMTDAQVAAARAEAEARKQADRRWEPLLKKWKGMLANPARRAEAEAAMVEVTDPLAVPTIARVFGTRKPADQAVAVRLLAQIDAPAASRVLAGLAVMSPDAEVRRAAVEVLRRRDPREFVRLWIGLIRDPIKYEVKPVGGPGSPGELFIEGKKANVRRVYAPPAMPQVAAVPGSFVESGPDGLPILFVPLPDRITNYSEEESRRMSRQSDENHATDSAKLKELVADSRTRDALQKVLDAQKSAAIKWDDDPSFRGGRIQVTTSQRAAIPIGQMMLEVQRTAEVAQRQLAEDVAMIDRTNEETRRANDPVLLAMRSVTGQDFGENQAAWSAWWTDQEGYAVLASATQSPSTFTEDVPLGYVPQVAPTTIVDGPVVSVQRLRHSCFGAGTMVRTDAGSRAIETLNAGDRVLVQDAATGALGYQPIVAVFHNPPNATLRITLDQDDVVVTGIHRFWKAGQGWVMARELKVGDRVRTVGGVASVTAVADDRVQPVFNLEVAEGRSFFIGAAGALVHDNSLVEPVAAPFDAPARRAE